MSKDKEPKQKYVVNLEGTDEPWERETISVAEIRELAGWDSSQPIIEVNLQTNEERTLAEDETVTLKPGHGFAKKVRFQRG
jgi:Multiubiquitin